MENKIIVHVAGVAWPYSPGHSAFGYTVERNGVAFQKAAAYIGASATDATAEYTGVFFALQWMAKMSKVLRIQKNPVNLTLIPVTICTNNLMIVNQVSGKWKVKPPFGPMCEGVKTVMSQFRIIEVVHVPKTEVEPAKEWARSVLTKLGHKPGFQGSR